MRNRILLYAVIYGFVGALIGVGMALYTKDAVNIPILLRNGKGPQGPMSTTVEEPAREEVKQDG